jgi:methionyl-tRNA formyltransferase
LRGVARARVVFLGAPKYAAIVLEEALDYGLNVDLVVTQEDKPFGRTQEAIATPVKELALKKGLKLAQPRKLDDIADDLEALKPDLVIVAAYGQMISDRVLSIAPHWNLHASLLPKYRGASPIQAALLNGDRLTGLTLMAIAKALDSGDVLGFSLLETQGHNLETLTIALAKTGAKLILSALEKTASLKPNKQNNCEASAVKKVKKADGAIDFNRSASAFCRAYRAYYGWPSIRINDDLRLEGVEERDLSGEAGKILAIDKDDGSICVACKIGAVKIAAIAPSGKNEMKARDYINGKRLKVGDSLYR